MAINNINEKNAGQKRLAIYQALLYLPAQLIAPIVQFFSIIAWTHLLSPTHLGVVTLAIASQEISFVLFFGWWQRYTLRFYRGFQDTDRKKEFLQSETAAIAMSSLLQSSSIICAVVLMTSDIGPNLVILIVLFTVTRSICNYMSDRARASTQILLYSLIQICGPVFGFIVGVPLLLRFGSSPSAVFTGFIVAQLLGLVAAVAMSDFFRHFPRINRSIFYVAFTFGGTVMIATLLATIAINVPRFIVSSALGLGAMGVFAVGYSLGLRASSFAVTLVTAGAYPLVVKRMEQEGLAGAFEQLRYNMTLVSLAVMPVAFGLLAVNEIVVDVLIDEKYRATTYVVLPLATIGGLLRYLRAHTSDQVFLVCLKPRYATWIAVIDIIIAVISTWFGLKLWGLAGAALGPMISGFCTLAASFIISHIKFGFRAPIGDFTRILIVSAAMCAGVRCVPVPSTAWGLACAAAVGAIIFGSGVALMLPEARVLMKRLLTRMFA